MDEISLERVPGPDSPAFEAVWEIYESSFPEDERRTREQQKKIFRDARYSLFTAFAPDSDSPIGFISSWNTGAFHFIEHLAIKESGRGRGAGTAMLKGFMEGKARIVIEVEPPSDDKQRRRIAFYGRFGFFLNDGEYVQPSYGPGKKPVEMRLMSFPERLGTGGFAKAREILHRGVYGLKEPLI